MKGRIFVFAAIIAAALFTLPCENANAQQAQRPQRKLVYDDSLDPVKQIDEAVALAKKTDRNVICQVGGNWCSWCLLFADFISNDEEIKNLIEENFVYIHVNNQYKNSEGKNVPHTKAMEKLGNPGRFGYPVLVVLDKKGNVIHFQDSSFLEEGRGYNKTKVMRFFKNWTPSAIAK